MLGIIIVLSLTLIVNSSKFFLLFIIGADMLLRYFLCLIFLMTSMASLAQMNPAMMNMNRPAQSAANTAQVPAKELSKEEIEIHERLKNPQETMRTFIQAMDKVKSGDNTAFANAIETMDLSQIDPPLRLITGKLSAERLINTLDRIAKINFSRIPDYESGPKWYFRKQTVTVDNDVHDVEIAIGKAVDGNWKFSPETIDTIETFYTSVAHQKVIHGITEYSNWKSRFKEKMPNWTSEEFLMFKKGQWIGLIAILLLSIGLFALVRFIITGVIRLKVRSRSLEMSEGEQYPSTMPFGLLAFSLTWLFGIRFLEFDVEMLEGFARASYILTAFFFVWSSLKLVDYVSLHFEKQAESTSNKFDDVLIPMIKKTSKVIVVAFGILLIAHSLTFDIASIVAGLGIGGVAVALAAKDTISNFFGSVTVLIDRPFQIGDYVILDKGLEGAVEEVGFRSTRLRTPVKSVVTIPNSVLANMAIDNYGLRTMRRFNTTLQLDTTTPVNKLQEFCDRLRYEIQINPMLLKDEPLVTINELTPTSINIFMGLFITTSDYKIEMQEKHKFIKRILEIANEVGVKFAFPVRRILTEQIVQEQSAQEP
jgi:MscS family membrane protein